MKIQDKIPHPFQVPDDFHQEFKNELFLAIEQEKKSEERHFPLKKRVTVALRYAAVIAIAFFVGRYSQSMQQETPDISYLETVYNQVSEDEILDFVIQDDILNDL